MLSSKSIIPAVLFALPLVGILSCAPARQDVLVASVGEDEITLGEYENLFMKTSASREAADQSSMEEREKFLDLLTNFRLKLLDAYASGLDKDPEVLGEINMYKGSLATSFLMDREVSRPGIRGLYNEKQTEYHASHILLDLPATAGPTDSTAAYAKANELIARLAAGEDFGKLATEFSKDPTVKENRGDLYYFSAGQMVRPFEEAVATMKPGEVKASPVWTQYGLHIIKLHDKRPSSGEIRCSHIMKRFSGPDPTPEDTAKAYAAINLVRDSLQTGGDFTQLARRNSEDPGSTPSGGDLGWFSRRRWIPEFDGQAFLLDTAQVSGIVRSRYGYHLIKCTGKRPPKTFEESEKEIQKLYEQSRYEEDKRRFMDRLRTETGFSIDQSVVTRFIGEVDTMSSMRDVHWADSLTPELRKSALFHFRERSISVDSTVRLLRLRPDLTSTSLRPTPFRGAIDKIGEQSIFLVKAEDLEKENPEFKSLMNEYLEGILLYQIEQEKVWNRVAVTDSALHGYFDANRDRFTFPDRVEFKEIRAADDSIGRAFLAQINKGVSFEEIAKADSVRMGEKNSNKMTFGRNSTKMSKQTLSTLKTVAKDLTSDTRLRINLIAHPDSSGGKTKNISLATKRLDAIKARLSGKLGIPESRISTFVRPTKADSHDDHASHAHATPVPNDTKVAEENARLNNEIDIDIVGRRAAVVGKVETLLTPIDQDERSKMANQLQPNGVSQPFRYKNGYSIVRFLKREPARQKTFEEAGTEVSSAFQEYESKRLEAEWLNELRTRYPVVEHKEVLGQAFSVSE